MMARCVVWVVLLFALCAPAWCQDQAAPTPSPAPASPAIFAPVQVNGRVLFQVDGPDAQARAARINARLQTLVTRPSGVTDFVARRQGASYLLVVGGIPVMTVTQGDAQDHLEDPAALAQQWGKLLTQAVRDARAERQSWVRQVLGPMLRSLGQLRTQALEVAPRVVASLLVIFLTFWGARLVRGIVRLALRRRLLDPNLQQLVRSLFFYGTWAIGLLVVASILGAGGSSLITALGVGAFALGFAFKDILSHFLAGIVLLSGHTFQIGDQIAVKGYEGTVERIDLRATWLRTYDNRLVIIPNADVFTTAVTNNTESPRRRQQFDVGLDYAADLATAQLVAFEAIRGTDGVLSDPGPDVLIADLAANWVVLRCRFYTDPRSRNVLAAGSEARRRVKDALQQHGLVLAANTADDVALHLDPRLQAAAMSALETAGGPSEETERRPGQAAGARLSQPVEASEAEAQSKVQAALPHDRTPDYGSG